MAKADGWGKMCYKFGERREGGLLGKVHLLGLLLGCLFWLCLPSAIQAQGEIVFDDSAPDRIEIRNDSYALTLNKTNGAIIGLTDIQAGAQLTVGSHKGCLWRIEFDRALNHQRGGCDYAAGAVDSFTYRWDEVSTTLIMTYTRRSQAAAVLKRKFSQEKSHHAPGSRTATRARDERDVLHERFTAQNGQAPWSPRASRRRAWFPRRLQHWVLL